MSLCKLHLDGRTPRTIARDEDLAGFVIDNGDMDIDALVGHGRGKFVTPFDKAHAAALEQPEEVDVSEFVFLVEPVEIEVQQRQLVANVLEQNVEGWARDVIVNAETGGKALGKLRLARTEISAQHDAIVHLHELGKLLTKPHGVIN